jgi:tetratricopeptide (TPR) repeat protein
MTEETRICQAKGEKRSITYFPNSAILPSILINTHKKTILPLYAFLEKKEPSIMSGTTVFFSYAHQDEPLVEELKKHLHLFKRQGLIAEWYDHNILPGTPLNEERERQLSHASLIVLCVTPDFLNSDYCYSVEMRQAMARHSNGDAWVLPILLEPVYWEIAPFAILKPLPEDGRFAKSWPQLNEALRNIAQGFLSILTILASRNPTLSLLSQSLLSPAEPIFMLPFHRDPFFTGRKAILTRLYSLLHSADPSVALTQSSAISGLGGIGKTQTAIEYAYQYRQDYTAILWVRSATREEIVSDFTAISKLLKIVAVQSPDLEILILAVKRWLEQNTGWLLIFDNADDLNMVAHFLPANPRGHIIFTTRSQTLGGLAQPIDLQTMSLEEGALLLLRRAHLLDPTSPLQQASTKDIAIAQQIVHVLDGLPLALNQAGAYIEEVKCTLQRYLELYRTHHADLLKRRGPHSHLFGHPDPVATTWQLSFRTIEAANPVAAELLRLCAFLSPDAIPEELFSESAEPLPSLLAPLATDPLAFENALGILLNYSLIRRDPKSHTLTIHRLVQTVLQDEMDSLTQKSWAEHVIKIIRAAFPVPSFENWEQCERLLPHVQICLDLTEKSNLLLTESAWLFNSAGLYLRHRHGLYSNAEKFYLKTNEVSRLILGDKHPNTLKTINNLASVYRNQGRHKEAEELHRQVRAVQEQVLGKEHPDTLTTLNNLASVYSDLGRHEEAEGLYVEVRVVSERVLGKEHPDTLVTLNNLAEVYRAQGRHEEAEGLYVEVRAVFEQVLGKEHPDTLAMLHNLALVYIDQGRYKEAEELYVEVRAMFEQVLGKEHPDTLTMLHNLAGVYGAQGRYKEAEELYRRVRAAFEQVLGKEHPLTLSTLHAIAFICISQGRHKEAEELYEQVCMLREHILGTMHPDLGVSLYNFARVYSKQGKYAQAEELYQRVLAIDEHVYGPVHREIITDLIALVNISRKQGKQEQADLLTQRIKTIQNQL